MLRLFEWLRHLDTRLLGAFSSPEPPSEGELGWCALIAMTGGAVILLGALILQAHPGLQLAALCTGLLMTAPYLQTAVDRARTSTES